MFDLEPGDELTLLLQTARSFARDELAPRIREHEALRALAGDVHRTYAEIGLPALELPDELGGADLGALARALVNEELAAVDAGAALALDRLGPALYPVLALAQPQTRRTLLSPIVESPGARAVLLCGPDARLERRGDALYGSAPWVPADRVDLLVVLDEGGALAVTEGIETLPVRGAGLQAAGGAELRLDAAPIAWRADDPELAAIARAHVRLYGASLLLGVLRQACEFTRAYAMEREAFGRPIAHHQALAFLCVDMHMAVEGARLLVHEAASLLDREPPHGAQSAAELTKRSAQSAAAAAFVETVEASRLVGPNAVQILGGHGFMRDHPAEKYMRESRALGLYFGSADAARDDAGRALCESTPPISLSHAEPV